MSYASEYIDLMNRLTSARSQRLMDVARMSGQAQLANAQVWGQLPGQLAGIANNAYGKYQDQQKLDLQQKRMLLDQQRADARENRDIDFQEEQRGRWARTAKTDADRSKLDAEKASAEQKEKARVAGEAWLKVNGGLAADAAEEAVTSSQAWKKNHQIVDDASRALAAFAGGTYEPLPLDPTPEMLDRIAGYVKQFRAGVEKQKVMTRSPEDDLVNQTTGEVIVSGSATASMPKLGTIERFTLDKYGPRATTDQQASARTEWERLNDKLAAATAGGDTGVWFPAGSPRQKGDGSWALAIVDRKTGKVQEVPFEEGTRPKPTEGGLTKQTNALSGLATLRSMDEMLSGPEANNIILKSALPGSPFARRYKAIGQELGDLLARLRTGAQINEQEMQLYMKDFLPSAADIILDNPEETKKIIVFKLGKFRGLFGQLARAGGLNETQVKTAVDKLYSQMTTSPGKTTPVIPKADPLGWRK